MKKIINGVIFNLDYSSDECEFCDADRDHDSCGKLTKDGNHCHNAIWRKEKVNKNQLKIELAAINKKYDELLIEHYALQKVYDMSDSALRSAERALDKRSEYQSAIAEFVGQVVVDVANNAK